MKLKEFILIITCDNIQNIVGESKSNLIDYLLMNTITQQKIMNTLFLNREQFYIKVDNFVSTH